MPFYFVRVGAFYHCLYIVGEGEIDSYRNIWVDGTGTDVSAQAVETSFGLSALDTNAACALYVGNSTQDVSAILSGFYATYSDTLEGWAVVYLRLPSIVVQRVPRVEVKVRGKQIKDYTDSQTVKYTDNAGNILIHWLEEVEGRTVDTTSAQALADACGETVGSGIRRAAGFSLTRPVAATATREILRAHAASWVVDTGAAVKFVPDRPADSVMDIGEDMILGDVQITTSSLRNRPDDVIANWVDNDTGITQQARASDVISNQPSNVQFVGIHDAAQAKREATERLNHLTLERDTVQFEVTMKGIRLEPGDVFRLTHSPTGIADKPYRCTNVDIRFGKARITGRGYQPNVYSDSVQTDPLIPDTDLTITPSAPSTPEARLIDTRTVSTVEIGTPFISWTTGDDRVPWTYEIQQSGAQFSGMAFDNNWLEVGQKVTRGDNTAFAETSSFESIYLRFRVRAVGPTGQKSAWVESNDVGTT